MAFSPQVAEDLLVKAARCCCLCRTYKGTKIEVHHIIPEADGGTDDYDNGIPLCFDCHADVQTYNDKHPRGRKFRPSELKRLRDQWFQIVAAGKAHKAPETTDYTREADKEFLVEFLKVLPGNRSIAWLRDYDFGGTFDMDWLADLYLLIERCKRPEFEFIDNELEASKQDLLKRIVRFTHRLGKETFSLPNPNRNLYRIPRELSQDDPVRYGTLKNELNDLAQRVIDSYDHLIRLAKRKLGINIKS